MTYLSQLPCAANIARLGIAQHSELTNKGIDAMGSLTGLHELNLSYFGNKLSQYSQLYPQHLLQPAPTTSTTDHTPIRSISNTTQSNIPTSPNNTSTPPPPQQLPPQTLSAQQLLQQRLQLRIKQSSQNSPTTETIPPIPFPSSSAQQPQSPTTEELSSQQLLQLRLQQRIFQQQLTQLPQSPHQITPPASQTPQTSQSPISTAQSEASQTTEAPQTESPQTEVQTEIQTEQQQSSQATETESSFSQSEIVEPVAGIVAIVWRMLVTSMYSTCHRRPINTLFTTQSAGSLSLHP